MKQYNSQIRYVEARPRKEKNRAKATASVVVAGSASSSVGGLSKSYVDSSFVTLATEQDIQGKKNFVGGLGVNGQYITYNAEKKYWELVGDLIVSGAITMFGSSAGFVPSTIMDGVQVDNDTIIINAAGQLQVIGGGGSGGTGGGLTAAEVNALISNALKPYALSSSIPTDNKQLSNGAGYITAAALSGLATEQYVTTRGYITSDALVGYATESWVTNKGYLTISSLLGYATEQWVGDNYLSSANFTKANIKSTLGISDWALATVKPSYTAAEVGALSTSGGTVSGVLELSSTNSSRSIRFNTTAGSSWLFVNNGEWYLTDIGWQAEYKVIHSSNIGSFKAGSAGAVTINYSQSDANYNLLFTNQADQWVSKVDAVYRDNRNKLFYNPSTGALTATSFVGNLTGNADSATKLATARTIWGQSFDGAGNVDDVLKINGAEILWSDGKAISSVGTQGFTLNLEGSLVTASECLAVGRATADAKFHVGGAAKIDSSLFVGNKQSSLHVAWLSYSGICATGSGLSGWLAEFGNGTQGVLLGCRGNGADVPSIGTVNATNLSILPDGGNVAIGGTTADAKLHIHYNSGTTGIELHRQGEECSIGFSSTVNNTRFVAGIWSNCFNIWSENKGTIMAIADNGATINGDLLTTGAITMFSQLSMKNVIDYDGLSLAQLAQIRPARFTWKDERDSLVHVGGIADEVMQILPEVIYQTSDDKLTMDYGSAAFYIGASLIKPVIDHEKRIAELEREVEYLREENRQLRAS